MTTGAGAPQRRPAWPTALVVLALVVGGLAVNLLSQQAHPSSASTGEEPSTGQVRNAIVFLVDDMPDFSCADAHEYLPRSSRWLADQGTCYENATTSTPVCCPARAQIQTGQLAHDNGVVSQESAPELKAEDTVQHDLGQAGIDTYGIGKNLNGVKASRYFGKHPFDNGFDHFDFWNSYEGSPGAFKLYDHHGRPYYPRDGLTTTQTNGAFLTRYLNDKLATGDPFYVYDAFFAPHKQDVGGGWDALPFVSPAHASSPVPPFRYAPEGFAKDKLPLFSHQRYSEQYYRRLYTARVRSLYDVDDQMAATLQRLDDAGVLDQTAVIFTSDNGYTDHGEDNWEGKSIPYPAAMDIPMLAYYPGRPAAVDDRDVALIDIAPTLYDVLGVTPGHVVDGHSLLGGHRRDTVYGEFYNETDVTARRESGALVSRVRTWRVVKRGRFSYVEWYSPTGQVVFREFYDDRAMTKNLLSPYHRAERPSPATVASFQRLLRETSTCQGTEEQGSPNPCP